MGLANCHRGLVGMLDSGVSTPISQKPQMAKLDIKNKMICSDLSVVSGGSTQGAIQRASTQVMQSNASTTFMARAMLPKS